MSVETLIYSRLSGFAGLAAIVGDRIYPGHLPQNVVLPAVSYFRVSAQRFSSMGTDSGVVKARFQFDCWSQKAVDAAGAGYSQARSAGEQVRQALQRWSSAGPPAVTDTFIENEADLTEPEEGTYHVMIEALVIYGE